MLDDAVDAPEVVGGLDNVVHVHCLVGDADGIGLKDVTRLVVGQPAALDMVGVVGKVNLDTVINAALDFAGLLLLERCQQWGCFRFPFSSGQLGIGRHIPCFAH